MALEKIDKKNFVSILGSDATLRIVVPEGTPDSIKREFETSDGKKGTKNELIFNKLTGKITNIEFYEGDYGKTLQIDVTDDAGVLTLSAGTENNFGEDIMKKLPNVDLNKDITFVPYSFEDNGKVKKGVTMTQDEVKINSFFYDVEKKENINGYPIPEEGTKDKDDWKVFFIKARKFLINYVEENVIPKLSSDVTIEEAPAKKTKKSKAEVSPDEVPLP